MNARSNEREKFLNKLKDKTINERKTRYGTQDNNALNIMSMLKKWSNIYIYEWEWVIKI